MNFRKTAMFLGCAVLMGTAALSAQIKVKNGDKIAFLGDSITQQGLVEQLTLNQWVQGSSP